MGILYEMNSDQIYREYSSKISDRGPIKYQENSLIKLNTKDFHEKILFKKPTQLVLHVLCLLRKEKRKNRKEKKRKQKEKKIKATPASLALSLPSRKRKETKRKKGRKEGKDKKKERASLVRAYP